MNIEQLKPIFNKNGGFKKNNSLNEDDFCISDSVILKETYSQVQIKNLLDLPYLSNANLNLKTYKIEKVINSLDSLVKESKEIRENIYQNLEKKKSFLRNIQAAQDISDNLEKDIAELKKKIVIGNKNSEKNTDQNILEEIEKEAKNLNNKRKKLYKSEKFRESIKKINLEKNYKSFTYKIPSLGYFIDNKINSSIFYKMEKRLVKILPNEKKHINLDLFNYNGKLTYYSEEEKTDKFLGNFEKTFSLLNFSKNKLKNKIIKKFDEEIKKVETHNINNLSLLNFKNKMSLFDLEKKKNLTDFIFEKEKSDIKIHPDGKLICTSSKSLNFYDICQKKQVLDFNNFFKKINVTNIQFSNNGYYIGCKSEKFLHIFDLRFCEKIYEIENKLFDQYQFDSYGFEIFFLKDKKLCNKNLGNENKYVKSLIKSEDFYLSPKNEFIFNRNFSKISQLKF